MRMSHMFSQTLREAPSDTEITSHSLLLRAGFIRQLGSGIFSYLPLAKRSLDKIENIMREEMDAIGGQEIKMPVINPADIWKETKRWYEIGSEMGRFLDRNDRDMVLAMTHEEVVADLVRKEIHSYKQMPQLIYHIQTKWRDDPRPRGGLVRVREFTMKDSYSLDADWEGLDRQYRNHYQAYFNIFNRCAVPAVAVKSDTGMMGGKLAHEYMYLTPIGEDTIVICHACGYTANRQIAEFQKVADPEEAPRPLEKVETPRMTTIEQLAEFLKVPASKTAKAVFLVARVQEGEEEKERFVFAVVRGDMDVNETKLLNAIGAKELRPAAEEEIKRAGAVPGFASPIGLKDCLVVVDDLIPRSNNLVSGANEENFHLLNVNYGRDFEASIVADISVACEEAPCPVCGEPVHLKRGVEIGNIFKLGTRYTEALGCTFLDAAGKQRHVIMGSYGIGSGRLLASVAEEHNDENGLLWPISVAPFQVHLVALKGAEESAETVYRSLTSRGIEVLFDDRTESPGVKFKDADLIGIPLRLTVSERAQKQGGVEVKLRSEADRRIVPEDKIVARLLEEIGKLESAIQKNVVDMPYEEERG